MKISSQEEYGIRCLMHLARAFGGHSPTIPEIAAAENLSQPYVAKLLAALRQAGLVEAVRGRTGGYHLTRPPAEVHLGEALLALGEPLFDEPGYCDRHGSPESGGPCVHQGGCTLRGLWQALERWMRHVLEQVTLEQLLDNDIPALDQLRAQLPPPPSPRLTLAPLSRGK